MLMPKKTKYRKSHKGRRGGKASRKVSISFGNSVPNAAASGYKETLTGVGWTITDSVGTIP